MAVIKFLNFEWDSERFKCLLSDNGDTNRRRARTCIGNGSLDLSSSSSYLASGKQKIDIYQNKHINWINSAIRNVQLAMEKRGIDSTRLSRYKSTGLKIAICP